MGQSLPTIKNIWYFIWSLYIIRSNLLNIYDALHDLVPLVQFKKREKHQWRSVTFSKAVG